MEKKVDLKDLTKKELVSKRNAFNKVHIFVQETYGSQILHEVTMYYPMRSVRTER
jgi:hypothetical protein